jgi:hypothetical protein
MSVPIIEVAASVIKRVTVSFTEANKRQSPVVFGESPGISLVSIYMSFPRVIFLIAHFVSYRITAAIATGKKNQAFYAINGYRVGNAAG